MDKNTCDYIKICGNLEEELRDSWVYYEEQLT
jgi:hypothetical protein